MAGTIQIGSVPAYRAYGMALSDAARVGTTTLDRVNASIADLDERADNNRRERQRELDRLRDQEAELLAALAAADDEHRPPIEAELARVRSKIAEREDALATFDRCRRAWDEAVGTYRSAASSLGGRLADAEQRGAEICTVAARLVDYPTGR